MKKTFADDIAEVMAAHEEPADYWFPEGSDEKRWAEYKATCMANNDCSVCQFREVC